jgi:hypothetical protein
MIGRRFCDSKPESTRHLNYGLAIQAKTGILFRKDSPAA